MERCFTFQWGWGVCFSDGETSFLSGGWGAQCRVLPTRGMGGFPPPAENLLMPAPPHQESISSYNPIKTEFSAVVIAPAPVTKNS